MEDDSAEGLLGGQGVDLDGWAGCWSEWEAEGRLGCGRLRFAGVWRDAWCGGWEVWEVGLSVWSVLGSSEDFAVS